MKVLITGITGFVGSHLAFHLDSQGHEVAGLHRPSSSLPAFLSQRKHWPASDDGQGFREALAQFRPDCVVHLAALYIREHCPENVGALIRSNIEYGAHLLEAMQETGCNTLVATGTSWQHYQGESCRPVNLYAATKQAFFNLADYFCDTHGLRLLELQLYDSYGPDDPRRKLIYQLQEAARAGKPLAMSGGEQRVHMLHIDDLTGGLTLACEQVIAFPPGRHAVYRLPSQRAVSLRELVAQFNEIHSAQPVQVVWGALPYHKREIFTPWEEGAVLPGWEPRISLVEGLRDFCR